jgi:hypothetical protein
LVACHLYGEGEHANASESSPAGAGDESLG